MSLNSENGTRATLGSKIALICDTPAVSRMFEAEIAALGGGARPMRYEPATLEALRADPPDMVVAVVMGRNPAMQCLCQNIGQSDTFARTRLMVVQDSNRAIDQRRAEALGADVQLKLPLDAAAFRKAAMEVLAEYA
ncbi:hypothetical protein G5B39_08710 [Rhodobacteraceae bacterium SC52]|nr:hypothetical protein G5B39_08710 [Rhodobacteraceae bacterium SC52]